MLGISVLVGSLSLGISLTLLHLRMKKLQKFTSDGIKTLTEGIEAQLKPVLETNSRAMSIIGTQGAEVKKHKAAERMIAKGIMGDNKMVMDGVRALFPQLADYIDENPEVGLELLPKVKQLYDQYQGNTSTVQSSSRRRLIIEE